jgi:hypothetical protein
MDFWATVVVVFRRWYVTIPAFILTVAAAAGIFVTAPKTYTSTSALVLTLPVTGGSLPVDPKFPNALANPLVTFNQGLSMTSSILIQALSTAEIAAKVGAQPGGRTTFKVTNGGSNPELMSTNPFIVISSEAPTAQSAYDVVARVTELAGSELAAKQRAVNAPTKTFVTATVVVSPTTPQEMRGSRLRAVVVTLALGSLMSLCAAFAAESFARGRRRRRTAEPESGSTGRSPSASGPVNGVQPTSAAPARH